jgi:hypothetical protein
MTALTEPSVRSNLMRESAGVFCRLARMLLKR